VSGHPIVRVELSAHDREGAGRFYSSIFGWKVQQMPEINDATFEAEPGPGFNPVSDETPAGTIMV
jgi:predicted enzyme related to lactoylglutathione lyase